MDSREGGSRSNDGRSDSDSTIDDGFNCGCDRCAVNGIGGDSGAAGNGCCTFGSNNGDCSDNCGGNRDHCSGNGGKSGGNGGNGGCGDYNDDGNGGGSSNVNGNCVGNGDDGNGSKDSCNGSSNSCDSGNSAGIMLVLVEMVVVAVMAKVFVMLVLAVMYKWQ